MLFPLFAVFGYLGLGILLLEAYLYATDKKPYSNYITLQPVVIFYVIVSVSFCMGTWMIYFNSILATALLVLAGVVITAIFLYKTPVYTTVRVPESDRTFDGVVTKQRLI